MEQLALARDLIIVLFAAFVGGAIAKKIRLPLLVGYLLSGIIIGRLSTGFLSDSGAVGNVAEIGVVLLLFTLGLEFSLTKLKELGETILLLSFIQVIVTMLLFAILLPFLGMDFYTALFLGAVFSLSSTAVALKILSDRGELETLHGELATGWLFMQDLYTLPLMILLPSIGLLLKNGSWSLASSLLFVKGIGLAFLAFIVVVFLGKRTIPYLIDKVADFKSRELLLIGTVSFCFLFAYLFQWLGLSYAMGAFVAGMLISASSSHHGIFAEVRPLRDLFSSVFFVSLGFIIDPAFITSHVFLVAALVLAVILAKFFISTVLLLILGYHGKTATLVGSSLVSVGEFAFILAMVGLSQNLIDSASYMTILAVSFTTLVVSIPLLTSADRFYYTVKRLASHLPFTLKNIFAYRDQISANSEIPLKDHIIVLGHGRVGKYICKALQLCQLSFVVIDYNHQLIKTLRQQGVNVIYGDPADIDVLQFAGVAQAKAILLAYADRRNQETVVTNILTLNPRANIICRAHFEEDQGVLKSLGVSWVIQPEFEAALAMTKRLLSHLLSSPEEISAALAQLRREHGMD